MNFTIAVGIYNDSMKKLAIKSEVYGIEGHFKIDLTNLSRQDTIDIFTTIEEEGYLPFQPSEPVEISEEEFNQHYINAKNAISNDTEGIYLLKVL